MEVALYALDAGGGQKLIAEGKIGRSGLLENPALDAVASPRAAIARCSRSATITRTREVELPLVPFLDVVTFDFGIDDPQQHYHLPMKCTPVGLFLLPRRGVRRRQSAVVAML